MEAKYLLLSFMLACSAFQLALGATPKATLKLRGKEFWTNWEADDDDFAFKYNLHEVTSSGRDGKQVGYVFGTGQYIADRKTVTYTFTFWWYGASYTVVVNAIWRADPKFLGTVLGVTGWEGISYGAAEFTRFADDRKSFDVTLKLN